MLRNGNNLSDNGMTPQAVFPIVSTIPQNVQIPQFRTNIKQPVVAQTQIGQKRPRVEITQPEVLFIITDYK